MDQTAMFTDEQMTGSGQTNMLDLIDRGEDRITELRSLPHIFWHDPGHGWLEVEHTDIIILDLLGDISQCSYRDGSKVYLEEDRDAGIYINALFGKHGERTDEQTAEFEQWRDLIQERHREDIFIRNLNPFR